MSAADHALSPLAARAAAHAVQTLAPDDWQSVLTQRGFAAMLAHWYQQIETGRADGALIESYLHSHRLAEQLVALAGE